MILALYVDDAIIFSNDMKLLMETKKLLSPELEMTDNGESIIV